MGQNCIFRLSHYLLRRVPMKKRILLVSCAIAAVAAIIFYCSPTQNPFTDTRNAKISLVFRDSKGLASTDLAVSDTVGNTVRIGVCPYLSSLIDSVVITIVQYRNNTDSVYVLKNFSSDIDTVWNSLTFTTVGKWTVNASAVVQGGRLYALSGYITIHAKTVSATIQPATETRVEDSIAVFTAYTSADTPATFQWYHDTSAMVGETAASFVKSHIALSDSGNYTCLVRDKWGDTGRTVQPAVLTITPKVIIRTNTKPVISVTGHSTILSTEICSLTVLATDPDSGQTHVFTVVKAPTGYTFSGNLFTWSPPASYLGTDTLKSDTAIFAVADNGQPPMSDTQKVAIIVSLRIPPPDSVKGVAAVSRINGNFVFTWNKSKNADQYAVYRSKDTTAAGFVLFATTQDTVFTATKDTGFYYYVIATNSKGQSAHSAIIHSTVINSPPKWSHDTITVLVNQGTLVSFNCADSCKDTNGDAVSFQLVSAGSVNDSLIGAIWKYTPSHSDSGLYWVKIKAWDGMDSSIVNLAVHVVVVTASPSAPTLVSPADNATNVVVAPTLTWNTVTGAATYRAQVSTVNTFAIIYTQDSTLIAGSKTISGLSNGTKYYWRVNAKNAGGMSAWASDSFTTIVGGPAIPVLTAPADNATNVPVALTLGWNTVTGAATYRVQVSTGNTFATIYAQDSTLTTGSKAISGLSNNTKYYWRVNATNAGGTSAWTTDSFTTIIAVPATPSLTAPADNATNVAVGPTLTWNAVTGAASYRVQVSTVNTFATIYAQDSTLTTGSKAISGLSNNTKYYWRVNATNAGGTSAWTTDSFTTIIAVPATPSLTAPADNATNVAVGPTLTWNTVTGAVTYRVQVSTVNTFATIYAQDSTLTTGSKAISGLSNGTKYYWRVDVTNAGGASAWATDSFTTIIGGPAIPVLTAPSDNATNVAVAPMLQWNAATGAATYRVQMATDLSFATPLKDSTLAALSKSLSGLANGTKYYWRVDATNAAGTSGWATDSFTTIIATPGVPALLSPTDNAPNVSLSPSPTLQWAAVTGAATYRVQVSTNLSFAAPLKDSTLAALSKAISGLANGTKYYWRVDATNAAGTSGWATDSFTTIVAAPAITAQPQSQSANKGGSVNLSVTATPAGVTYVWHQKNNATVKSTTQICTLTSLAYSDSGQYYVVVSNAAGSVTSDTTAKVTVMDNVNPSITLNGSLDTTVLLNTTYTDKGVSTATDDRDGNVISRTSVTGLPNMAAVGKYTVTWHVSDLTGNSNTATRIVRVQGWEAGPDIPTTYFSAVQTSNGDLYVGYDDPNFNTIVVVKYDGTTNTWQSVGSQVATAFGNKFQLCLSPDKSFPYVVYKASVGVGASKLTIGSNSWTSVMTPGCGITTYPYDYSSAISSDGTPYVMMKASLYNTNMYPFKANTGTQCWDSAFSNDNYFTGYGSEAPLAAMNSQDNLFVAYDVSYNIDVMFHGSSFWTELGGGHVPSSGSVARGLILDESVPQIPYVLGVDSVDLSPRVWKLGTNQWTSLGHVTNVQVSDNLCLAYSSFSKGFYVGYLNATNDSCFVLTYSGNAWQGFPQLTNGAVPVTNAASFTTQGRIQVLIGQSVYYVLYPKAGSFMGIEKYQIVQ
jgi:Domain of unknown function (DUF5011)